MKVSGAAIALWSFWRARRRARTLNSRAAIDTYQERKLRAHLDWVARHFPIYASLRGSPLEDWPIVDKVWVNAHFDRLNAPGLSLAEARSIAERGGKTGRGYTAGMSSGTSGNRSFFVVSDAERFMWLGTILARTIGSLPLGGHRIAMLHATASELYEAASQGSAMRFRFFDLSRGLEAIAGPLEAFAPTILIASPNVLRLLAARGARLSPRFIFAGGEVLDPLDAQIITAAFGVRPRGIYQAAEGFLGVECAHGTLHLNEDGLKFELVPMDGIGDGVTPIITDFRRRAQAMIRYRLNDVLVPTEEPCRCGCALLGLRRIEGRMDDTLLIPDARTGALVQVLPDPLRNAILDADHAITDFRIRQTAPLLLEIALPHGGTAPQRAVIAARVAIWSQTHGLASVDIVFSAVPEGYVDGKLRRVRREWNPVSAPNLMTAADSKTDSSSS